MSAGLLGIIAVMSLPMIGLGVTLYYSYKSTKNIGEDL
jgi:hypothetical protein